MARTNHIWPSLLILALAMSAPAIANDDLLPPGKWWEDERLAARLGLEPEQRERIRALVFEHARRMVDLNAAVRRSELDLRERVEGEPFEPEAVRAAFTAFQQARQRLEGERFEMLLAVRGELTREQWRRMQEARRHALAGRDARPGRPGPPPPGGRRP